MTLETIARLENALGIDIIKSTLTHVSGYHYSPSYHSQYLNDSGGEVLDPSIKTSELSHGYKPKRK